MFAVTMRLWLALAAAATLALAALPLRAEVSEVRISKGFGILYLPLIVMQDQKLLEKQAAKAGLGELKVTWLTIDGGNIINDAMLAGTLDIAGTGAPGFVTLWSKGKASPRTEVIGVSGLSATRSTSTRTSPRSSRSGTSPRRTASRSPASRPRSPPWCCRWR